MYVLVANRGKKDTHNSAVIDNNVDVKMSILITLLFVGVVFFVDLSINEYTMYVCMDDAMHCAANR